MAMRTGALDAPLLQLSSADVWDVRAAMTHTLILGTTGSGKTSTSLKNIILSMLFNGFGCLFCVAKAEDAESILRYCHDAGRAGSVINWNGRNFAYNFLAHELARSGNINNVIDCLMEVLEMIRTSGSASGRPGEQFWSDSVKQQLRASVAIVYIATGTVRIGDLLAFVRSGPTSREEMTDPAWQASSAFYQMFHAAVTRLQAGALPGLDEAVLQRAMEYWKEYARLDNKTASNIRISLTTLLSRFESSWLRDAFCGETTICPELLMSGAIIVMNFPVQTHGEDAAVAQKLFKYMAQRVLLARNGLAPHLRERPVALIADECHTVLHHDAEFMAQCRSSRVAVVMATQSLPTIYHKIGGDHPHDRAHHFINGFGNIVLHSSACPDTNEMMARKIGKSVQRRASFNESQGSNRSYGMNMGEGTSWNESTPPSFFGPRGGFGASDPGYTRTGSEGGGDNWGRNRSHGDSENVTHGWSEQTDWIVEPGFFSRGLKTGGTANGNRVTAVWYSAGRRFAASNGNALLIEMVQS